MVVTVPIPTAFPLGRPAGQVRPTRIIDKHTPLSKVGRRQQESSVRDNVTAYGRWVSDGQIEIVRTAGDSDFWRQEWVTFTGGTHAYYVTWVEIDGIRVSHPMVWGAYGETQADCVRLATEILPLYRCMSLNTWRMFWRNFPALNGGWTHTPGDVLYASLYPWRVDPHYPLSNPNFAWPEVRRPKKMGE